MGQTHKGPTADKFQHRAHAGCHASLRSQLLCFLQRLVTDVAVFALQMGYL
jgi:hypothetical protein